MALAAAPLALPTVYVARDVKGAVEGGRRGRTVQYTEPGEGREQRGSVSFSVEIAEIGAPAAQARLKTHTEGSGRCPFDELRTQEGENGEFPSLEGGDTGG